MPYLFTLIFFLLLTSVNRAEESGSIQIIDCHVHLWDIDRQDGLGWIKKDNKVLNHSFLPKDHVKVAQANGVVGVVVVQAGRSLPDNQWNLDITASHKELYRGVVGNLSQIVGTPEFKLLFEKLCGDPRYLGYRISNRYREKLDEALYADLNLTAQKSRSVDFLVGGYSLAEIDEIARQVPSLHIILDHLGGVNLTAAPIDAEWEKGLRKAAQNTNVYCKVSALFGRFAMQPAPRELSNYSSALDVVFDAFGEDRIVYGSDWPVSEETGDYASVLALTREYFNPKGRVVLEKLFFKNAVNFYRIPPVN